MPEITCMPFLEMTAVNAHLTMQMTEKANKDFNWLYSHAVSILGELADASVSTTLNHIQLTL